MIKGPQCTVRGWDQFHQYLMSLYPNPMKIIFVLIFSRSHFVYANERRRYIVTSSLIGWAHIQNDPWFSPMITSVTKWWPHQMETFSALLALCAGNSPVAGEFPSQRPVTRSFGVFFDLRLNKRLSKQSRRHRTHYGVIVMFPRSHECLSYNNKMYFTKLHIRVS